MDDHTFKHIKLTGTSTSTMEDAADCFVRWYVEQSRLHTSEA